MKRDNIIVGIVMVLITAGCLMLGLLYHPGEGARCQTNCQYVGR